MRVALRLCGGAALVAGIVSIPLTSLWAPPALEFVYDGPVSWPFDALVPFLPVFTIAFGALLLVRSRS